MELSDPVQFHGTDPHAQRQPMAPINLSYVTDINDRSYISFPFNQGQLVASIIECRAY